MGLTHLFKNLPEMRFERMTYRLEGGCSIQLSYSGKNYFIYIPYINMKIFDFK